MKFKLKSSKLKDFLSKYFFPFIYFRYKKFYKLVGLDLVFILSALSISFLLGLFTNGLANNGVGLGDLFLSLFFLVLWTAGIILVYAAIKYLFYSVLSKKRKYNVILKRHLLAMVFTSLITFVMIYVFVGLINMFLIPEKVEMTKKIILVIFVTLGYILMLKYQCFDKEKFFSGYKSAIKSVLSLNSIIMLYIDVIIFLLIFKIFQLFTYYVLQSILVKMFNNVLLFKFIVPNLNTIISFIFLGIILTLNKLIIFEIKPKELK